MAIGDTGAIVGPSWGGPSAQDINDAFADVEVKAIFAPIGGDDSIRILPFLDPTIIKKNPKILMGYPAQPPF